MITSGEYETG